MSKKRIIGLIITLVLILVGIVSVGLKISNSDSAISLLVKLAVFTITFLYVLFDYKMPHSNIFKYIMLIFGLSLSNSVLYYAKLDESISGICSLLCVAGAVLVGYMSGRLGKISKNGFIIALVFVLLLTAAVFDIIKSQNYSFVSVMTKLSDTITWVVLSTAYVTGFSDHKEAGMIADNEAIG